MGVSPLHASTARARREGLTALYRNWGLTDHELTTIPPSLVRGFMKGGHGGFGAQLAEPFGRLLMRGEFNSELYEPLQGLYEEGWKEGTDVWIHKNRYACYPAHLALALRLRVAIRGSGLPSVQF